MTKKNIKKLSISESSHFGIKETLPDYNKSHPVFSFHHIKYGGDNCLSKCETPSKALFAHKLLLLSQRTWADLLTTQKESLGQESIPISRFKIPLPKIVTPDVKKIMVFRFSEGERMAGIRINDTYHIIAVFDFKIMGKLGQFYDSGCIFKDIVI